MLSYDEVCRFWVAPALSELAASPLAQRFECSSDAAHRLVAATGYLESRYAALQQRGGGPALGFWQMEPRTYADNVAWAQHLGKGFSSDPSVLAQSPVIGAMLCRIHYGRKPFPLNSCADLQYIASIHKQYYNTALGKADAKENAELLKGFMQ